MRNNEEIDRKDEEGLAGEPDRCDSPDAGGVDGAGDGGVGDAEDGGTGNKKIYDVLLCL